MFEAVLRETLHNALHTAKDRRDERALATLRLIHTALRERDLAAREHGRGEGISDDEVAAMLRTMVAQRRQDIPRCERTARLDLVEQEEAEIRVIESLLPPLLGERALTVVVDEAICAVQAAKAKDIGPVMSWLQDHYGGQFDRATARRLAGERLE